MQLTIRILGLEMLHVELCDPAPEDTATDCTTYPLGFTASPGDQRWEKSPELE